MRGDFALRSWLSWISESPQKYKIQGGTPTIFFILEPHLFCPVLCRMSDTPIGIKYRAERPPFFRGFWSTSEYPVLSRIFESPQKYKIQDGTPTIFLEFWSNTYYLYSAAHFDEVCSNCRGFSVDLGGGPPGGQRSPVGAHGGSEMIL